MIGLSADIRQMISAPHLDTGFPVSEGTISLVGGQLRGPDGKRMEIK